MSLINKFFSGQKAECPRCLGKGDVGWDDIKRLKKELKWIPGTCAYCNGKGTVNSDLPSKIPVDTAYLTTDLSSEERKRVLLNDKGARQRALYNENQTDNFISEIEYLHFTGNLDPNKIAEFYLLHQKESDINSRDRIELIDYINRVIKRKG